MAASMIPPPHADEFLAGAGWGGAAIAPLAEWLGGVGLSAPEILARDEERGLLLLSDLGSDRLREQLDVSPQREEELYGLATDVLVHLHDTPPMAGLSPHGLNEWLAELDLFTQWYCPAVELEVDRAGYRAAWEEVLGPVASDGLRPVTVLRDYHAENIMLVDGRSGVAHMGLLDFQDALAGHPAYDLCSVLEDARRDVSPAIERAMIDRYVAATGAPEAFERAYWALAAQRNTRILGVFTRLWKRDGKPGYRRFQPRMWGLLERDLAQPHLTPVRDWFDRNVPADRRVAPWLEQA
jgi:aminoglycoside/choline kinase family phosphotransferase